MPSIPNDVPGKSALKSLTSVVSGLCAAMLGPIRSPGYYASYAARDVNRRLLRDQIARIDAGSISPRARTYLAAVDAVNTELDHRGVALTPASYARIRQSIDLVGKGMSGPTLAHGTEAWTFAAQWVFSLRRGQHGPALEGAVGTVANAFGMMLSGVGEHTDMKRGRLS